jgi:hypothetical protein
MFTRSKYSINKRSKTKYLYRAFRNSFWVKSPYKGPPTPEVIGNWHHLTHTDALNLTAEEVSKMGLSLDSVQFPPELGGVSILSLYES